MAFMSNAVHLPDALRRRVATPPTPRRASFTAIDFETATRDPNSACAIGLVRVEGGRIVRRAYHLIRPPSAAFEFTYLHGIDWATVHAAPTFAQVWPRLVGFFENIDFAAAHNAEFDVGVLRASYGWYGLPFPAIPFQCTVRLAPPTDDAPARGRLSRSLPRPSQRRVGCRSQRQHRASRSAELAALPQGVVGLVSRLQRAARNERDRTSELSCLRSRRAAE